MTEMSSIVETTFSKHVEWSIESFLDLPKTENYNMNSSWFSLYGASWCLRIYTKGHVTKNAIGWLSLYLHKKESAVEYLVDFRMGIKTSDSSQAAVFNGTQTLFQKCETGHGRAQFIKRSHLKISKDNLVPHGTLTIFCTARILGNPCIPSYIGASSTITVASAVNAESQTASSDGVSTLIENFKELYLSKRCADVRITVKGKEFLAHRNILTARSTAFSAMLTNDVAGESNGIIEIADCDPLSFEDFLIFLYTGDLGVVSISNAASLYATAEKHDLKDLKEECVLCMSSKLDADSFCDVINLAIIYNETGVLMAATNYFLENAKDILRTFKWPIFLTEHPKLGTELFLKYLNTTNKNKDHTNLLKNINNV